MTTRTQRFFLISAGLTAALALTYALGFRNLTQPTLTAEKLEIQQPLTPKQEELNNEELLHASESGNLQEVIRLLEAGAAINSSNNSQKYTPLHGAVNWDRTDIVSYLLEQGADVNVTPGNVGAPPLMLLMGGARIDMVSLLLNNGADANVSTPFEHILDSWIKGFSFFSNYSEEAGAYNDQQIEILKLLLEHNADVNSYSNERDQFTNKIERKFMHPSMTDFAYFAGSNEDVVEVIAEQVRDGVSQAIHPAYAEKKQRIIELFKQYGAKP